MATDTYVYLETVESIASYLTAGDVRARTGRMEPGIKAQWLSALRSGEYKQGQGKLAKVAESGEKQYCCLGVLCDIAIRNKVPGLSAEQRKDDNAITFTGPGGANDRSMPPGPFASWAKLPTRDPLIPISEVHAHQAANPSAPRHGANDKPNHWTTLASLNDRGFSFAFIADMIEKYL
jgi:hypothetical protein